MPFIRYRPIHTIILDVIFLSLMLGGLFFIMHGTPPLFIPDGARYAEIGREMAVSGDYVTPHLNGIKYFEKPILFYWLTAFTIQLMGLKLWALHSINGLLGILGGLLTYLAASRWFGRTTGYFSALIMGSSTLYFTMVHIVNLDLSLTVFLSASLYAFLIGAENEKYRRFYMWMAFTFSALAVLTKGTVGLLFPIMIVGAWISLLGKWQLLKRLYLPSSLLIFILIAAPWHILVQMKNPEFFKFYFLEQQLLRYASLKIGHYQPVWYFIPILIAGFFPWICFLPQAIAFHKACFWKHRHQHPVELFLLLWAILIFVFFSFSKSKLVSYILPVIPPISILTANYLAQGLALKNRLGMKWGFGMIMLLGIASASYCFLYTHFERPPYPRETNLCLYTAGIILIVGTLLSTIFLYRDKILKALITLFITMSLFLLMVLASIPYLNTRSIEPLAATLKPLLKPQDEVVSYNDYYQDLPFYLERQITVVNWKNELSFGITHQSTQDWMIDEKTFWQRFYSRKRLYVILNKKKYQSILAKNPNVTVYVLGQSSNNVLISNQKPTP